MFYIHSVEPCVCVCVCVFRFVFVCHQAEKLQLELDNALEDSDYEECERLEKEINMLSPVMRVSSSVSRRTQKQVFD